MFFIPMRNINNWYMVSVMRILGIKPRQRLADFELGGLDREESGISARVNELGKVRITEQLFRVSSS